MDSNDFLKKSLEHFKQQRQAKIEELKMLDITIRHLQQQTGEVLEPPQELGVMQSVPLLDSNLARPAQPAGENYKPRPDEFFSLSIAEAARTYLEKVGHAMSVDDILRVITSGGCKVGGADPKRTLSITLSMAKREFVATGNGNYGLRVFYPNMPKLGRPEGGTRAGKKGPAKRKTKVKTSTQQKAKAMEKPPGYDAGAVSAAVNEALSDHKAKSPEEVLAAVERKVGYPVKKIAVYGTLRKKDFEQIGDKYRLRQVSETSQVIQ
jgi:hypothetical protein